MQFLAMNDRKAPIQLRPGGITSYSLTTLGEAAVGFSVIIIGFLFARYVLDTNFQLYDDEGYFLIALAHYLKHGHLYTETYSQYGPFYFYFQNAVFRLLGLSITHDSGRFVTLLCLTASASFAGMFIYKLSKSLLLGSAAMLAYFRLGSYMANEPGHPQQVVLVLLTLSACLSLWAGADRTAVSLFLLGAVGTALFFTKINVGAFYFVALAQALVCVLSPGRLRTVGTCCTLASAILLPILLMHSHFLDWARGYCLVAVVSGGATFAWSSLLRPDAPIPLRRVLYAVAGAASAGALIVCATMLQGMSLSTLVRGVLLDPAKLPNAFVLPLLIGNKQLFSAIIVVAYVSLIGFCRGRFGTDRHSVGALRCIVGLIGVFLLVNFVRLDWVVPFLPLGLIPVTGRTWRLSDLLTRVFIASLAATQFLQAYPVAGTQLSIAAAPVLLWAFVLIVDGVDECHGALGSRRLLYNALSVLIILVTLVGMFHSGLRSSYRYPASRLRGSTSLHLPPELEQRFLFLSDSISANCNVLFTMPGMGSFNFWSGVPAPNGSNATAWIRLFSPERQKEILELLQANPGACVLYSKEHMAFWQITPEEVAKSPLASYIADDMPKVAEAGGYEIRTNPGRNAPWIQAGSHSSR